MTPKHDTSRWKYLQVGPILFLLHFVSQTIHMSTSILQNISGKTNQHYKSIFCRKNKRDKSSQWSISLTRSVPLIFIPADKEFKQWIEAARRQGI